MLDIILISILKILDNFLLTSKTILVQKNRAFLAAVVVILSQFMFYFVISKIIDEDSLVVNAIVAVASGVGSLFAMKVNDKFSKDKQWVNYVTYKNKDNVIELTDYLIKNKIRNFVMPSYNRDWSDSLTVIIFADTKDQSRMIDEFIEDKGGKLLRKVID